MIDNDLCEKIINDKRSSSNESETDTFANNDISIVNSFQKNTSKCDVNDASAFNIEGQADSSKIISKENLKLPGYFQASILEKLFVTWIYPTLKVSIEILDFN